MKRYQRRDWRLDLHDLGGMAQLELRRGQRLVGCANLPRQALEDAAAGDTRALDVALKAVAVERPLLHESFGNDRFDRLLFHVNQRRWAKIDWESRVPRYLAFVRACAVPPRILQTPFTFPMRMLEAGLTSVIDPALRDVFRGSDRQIALENMALSLEELPARVEALPWPTVEVLHLRGPELSGSEGGRWQRWLQHFAEVRQTRLIVLEPRYEQLANARSIAQTLVERGGPAMWVAPLDHCPWGGMFGFYACLVHDRPLDWIRATLGVGELFGGAGREELLRFSTVARVLAKRETVSRLVTSFVPKDAIEIPYGVEVSIGRQGSIRGAMNKALASATRSMRLPKIGSGVDLSSTREPDRLRFGALVSTSLADQGLLVSGLPQAIQRLHGEAGTVNAASLTGAVTRMSSTAPGWRSDALRATLQDFVGVSRTLRYEDHESDGMLPLAAKLAETRAVVRQVAQQAGPSEEPVSRHVNAAFYEKSASGEWRLLEPRVTRLVPGKTHFLGVQVGEREAWLASIGSTALLHEVDYRSEGGWLEIGITPIDFTLVGDCVQTLWLPAGGLPSSLVVFAVMPCIETRVPGIARLRISIFHENNLVQSFLLAAQLDGTDSDGDGVLTNMANALGVPLVEIEHLGRPGYVTRQEYSSTKLDEAGKLRPRALTLVANESAGQRIVTVKGEELFEVCADDNLPDAVTRLREALDSATIHESTYRYINHGAPNAGDPAGLLEVLWDLAEAGWALFDLLVPDEQSQRHIRAQLATGSPIQAAHVSASKPIPWALIYDRPVYDRRAISDPALPGQSKAVERMLCQAALPFPDGKPSAVECGGQGCVLHDDETKRRLAHGLPAVCADTVICPKRFWGFNVPIEVPAQRVSGIRPEAADNPVLSTRIASSRPTEVAAAFNPSLALAISHRQTLGTLMTSLQASMSTPTSVGRDAVVDLLRASDPGVVYLYCHALPSGRNAQGRLMGPSLDFGLGHQGQMDDVLEAAKLSGGRWSHAPLVFINGCSSVGFSAHAASPFVDKFISGRGAAAVIGTEVVVFEVLAKEFAEAFFSQFLARQSAGTALLLARRSLLAKLNPLGLVYTLYGSADLALDGGP